MAERKQPFGSQPSATSAGGHIGPRQPPIATHPDAVQMAAASREAASRALNGFASGVRDAILAECCFCRTLVTAQPSSSVLDLV